MKILWLLARQEENGDGKNHLTMRKELVFSFLLSCIVIGTTLWIVDKSLSKPDVATPIKNPSHQETSDNSASAKSANELRSNSEPDVAAPNNSSPETAIHKCIEGGKIIYSDQACLHKIASEGVKLYDSAGIASPPKEKLEDLTARRKAAEAIYRRQNLPQAALNVQSIPADCEALAKRVEWLDSLARQPQSAATQDWIRQEKEKTRNKQFELHC
jgi:hypothetical protein